ncbi:MAG TPA: polyphosphate kinase 1 [Lentisphaeria bacterium]|nr:polyphosphate kinase 1 [Lentisphaeria bacterium]
MSKLPLKQDNNRYFSRELSWLDFDRRVFEEAEVTSAPLLERLKFLAITASNLDEFFMVRVGGLRLLIDEGVNVSDLAGLSPEAQLAAIDVKARALLTAVYRELDEIERGLAARGLVRVRQKEDLEAEESAHLHEHFVNAIAPALSPAAVGGGRTFPRLANLGLNLAVRLAPTERSRTPRYAVIPLPAIVDRHVLLPTRPGETVVRHLLLEDVVGFWPEELFPGETVQECVAFRITRNGDITVDEGAGEDLSEDMWRVLQSRKTSPCVRLELDGRASELMQTFLRRELSVQERDVFLAPGPPGLATFMRLTSLPGFDDLRRSSWTPLPPMNADLREGTFKAMARKDILLVHPYEDFAPVVRFIEEAAEDDKVLAIKITLYRTSRTSPIVAALAKAARRGKSVTALVELKARFDEERNMIDAEALLEAGVQVLYGVKGLKTHSKVCLVIRKDGDGIRRYMHFGTGNYNESTARIYSDVSYFTCHPDYGQDASAFFNAITGYSTLRQFRQLAMSPVAIRQRLLESIEDEISRSKGGQRGLIMVKVNSLNDRKLIDALYSASQAGVKVMLNVRGICCLRPGVPGLSENISVVSIVDGFLEHARIMYFHHGGKPNVFISSADWMPRNLDRRVELLVPVIDQQAQKRLIAMLQLYCTPGPPKSRVLQPDGTWLSPQSKKGGALSVQEQLCAEAEGVHTRRPSITSFEPVKPKKKK